MFGAGIFFFLGGGGGGVLVFAPIHISVIPVTPPGMGIKQ